MNILVCVSRVPDTATKVKVADDGKSIATQNVKFILNPYDEFAVEEGLQLREQHGGSVTVLTVGGQESTDILRTALAMGADKAALIQLANPDSYQVAVNIAQYARNHSFDLILFGRQSIDFDSFQVPPMVAQLLDLPCLTIVSQWSITNGTVKAERDIEGGKEEFETTLPLVASVQKGINEPRYPKLPDIIKAKSKPIETIEPVAVEPQLEILSMEIPQTERRHVILGDSDEDLEKLIQLLREEAKVI